MFGRIIKSLVFVALVKTAIVHCRSLSVLFRRYDIRSRVFSFSNMLVGPVYETKRFPGYRDLAC